VHSGFEDIVEPGKRCNLRMGGMETWSTKRRECGVGITEQVNMQGERLGIERIMDACRLANGGLSR